MKKIAFFCFVFSGFAFAQGTPSLCLSKSVCGEGSLTYTLKYENVGNGTATDCVIYDQIPERTEYIEKTGTVTYGSATIWYSKNGGASWQIADPGTETKVIQWKFNKNVPPEGTGTIKFKVKQK